MRKNHYIDAMSLEILFKRMFDIKGRSEASKLRVDAHYFNIYFYERPKQARQFYLAMKKLEKKKYINDARLNRERMKIFLEGLQSAFFTIETRWLCLCGHKKSDHENNLCSPSNNTKVIVNFRTKRLEPLPLEISCNCRQFQ
jgi:hypothetical protein